MSHAAPSAERSLDRAAQAESSDATPAFPPFSPCAAPSSENATTIAARRALMSRKGLTVEEAAQRAHARRRDAGTSRRMGRNDWLTIAAAASGGWLAWLGSTRPSQVLLLTGYALLALALLALLARATRTPSLSSLDAFYLPDEIPATSDDIALLRRLAGEDAELEAITNAWWRSMAPIRKGDIRLALELRRAKRG